MTYGRFDLTLFKVQTSRNGQTRGPEDVINSVTIGRTNLNRFYAVIVEQEEFERMFNAGAR
ncbi:hypothetical protein E4U12_008088 [Claviceps purpurea]|nr:hypothetical protein E4U12_008088 [Claviceps purpurea]